jgi:hypothetical protein
MRMTNYPFNTHAKILLGAQHDVRRAAASYGSEMLFLSASAERDSSNTQPRLLVLLLVSEISTTRNTSPTSKAEATTTSARSPARGLSPMWTLVLFAQRRPGTPPLQAADRRFCTQVDSRTIQSFNSATDIVPSIASPSSSSRESGSTIADSSS